MSRKGRILIRYLRISLIGRFDQQYTVEIIANINSLINIMLIVELIAIINLSKSDEWPKLTVE